MTKPKACRICRTIYRGKDSCPKCDSKELTESFKGRIIVTDPEKSEIAQKLNIKEKGEFAIKSR